MLINVWSDSGYVGGDRREVIEVPDTFTKKQIDKRVEEWFSKTIHSDGLHMRLSRNRMRLPRNLN